MKYAEVEMSFKRMPNESTRICVWIDGVLWRLRIVPFDSLIQEVGKIDNELSRMSDYFPSPFRPEAVRLVNAVRAYRKTLRKGSGLGTSA